MRSPARHTAHADGETNAIEPNERSASPSRAGSGPQNRERHLLEDSLPSPPIYSPLLSDRHDELQVQIT